VKASSNWRKQKTKPDASRPKNERTNSMKNKDTNNRTRLSLKPALLTLCVALLAGNVAVALASAHQGKGGDSVVRRTCSHAFGKTSGLRVGWTSWLRRSIWF
jgi:hypothetical protein